MSPTESDIETLDLRGLKCPLPALYARKALERAAPGASIAVVSDDPLAGVDLPHLCNREGYDLVSQEQVDGVTTVVLRRPA